jgi:PKD repeat protein
MIAKLMALMLIVFSVLGLAIVPAGGGLTQRVVVDGVDNNPYQLMQQAYATEAEPEVPEEGGEEQQPTPLTASMNIDSTNGDTAPATFLFETFPEGGTEPYTFSWNFGDGSPQSNEQNTEHTFVNPGTYVVSLTVIDSAGETVSDRREVNVRPATTTTTEEPEQPPTNTTTPTEPGPPTPIEGPAVEQNQTETDESFEPVEPIQCPPGYTAGNPIVLRSGTGSGPTDPLNEFSADGGTTWSSAFIITQVNQPSAWAPPLTNTQYIWSNQRLIDEKGGLWYKVNFTLPSGFSNPSLNVQIHADDVATIFLNPASLSSPTNQIGAQNPRGDVSNYQNPPEFFSATEPALFVYGTNTLYFRIINFGGLGSVTTGFDYLANVAYCQPAYGGPPGGNAICPATNVQHWDKIIFQISDAGLAASLGLPAETHLDIKVLDDPKTVADIQKKVLDFLKLPDNPQNRNAIFVIDVEYAIICASAPPPNLSVDVGP